MSLSVTTACLSANRGSALVSSLTTRSSSSIVRSHSVSSRGIGPLENPCCPGNQARSPSMTVMAARDVPKIVWARRVIRSKRYCGPSSVRQRAATARCGRSWTVWRARSSETLCDITLPPSRPTPCGGGVLKSSQSGTGATRCQCFQWEERGEAVHRLLVVEDDHDIRSLIEHVLSGSEREVSTAESGAEALAQVSPQEPDLVTLDLSLPDADGVEICREIRSSSDAYIVMITGRDDQTDRLYGLDVGADEYLAKPFDPLELQARVTALLRRPRLGLGAPPAPVEARDLGRGLVLDEDARQVRVDGVEVPLSPTEYVVLAFFFNDTATT